MKPALDWTRTRALLAHNERWIPGGLASLNRRAEPCVSFARGRGAHVWDFDGNEYIDYHFGFAPYILGHNDPEVNAAVITALERGLSNFGSGATVEEGQLAECFLRCVPSAERVQFMNTGSEATAQAIRIARAWTGRSAVLKVQGGYNGHHNMVAANLLSTPAQLGGRPALGDEYPLVPITAGIPPEEAALIHAVEFNDLAAVATVARRVPLAAMILEPVLQNVGVVPPSAGYLEGLRRLADEYGFLLIFDEVKTGFRASLGGFQALCGVTPDLSTWGKAIANGVPLGAVAGKLAYLELVLAPDPAKRVLLAGTYNAHPIPMCAALATLRKLMDPAAAVYARLERLGTELQRGQEEIIQRRGLRAVISRLGSASCLYLMARRPTNWWEIATEHDMAADKALRVALIQRGVYQIPIPAKQASLSFAHTDDDLARTLEAFDDALGDLQTSHPQVFP